MFSAHCDTMTSTLPCYCLQNIILCRLLNNAFTLVLYTTYAVNECEVDNGGCEEMCTDTPLSYLCSCCDGYELETDRHNCSGKIYCYIFLVNGPSFPYQILMSALLTVMDVNKCVRTLRDHTCVVVEKVIL